MSNQHVNLVAGVAGFIGTHLAEAILRKGEKVIGIDNLITGSLENIERLQNNSNFSFIHHDIADPLRISENINFVYNLACPASPTDFEKLRISILRACCFGSYNLLELSRMKKAQYIFASTSEVYGNQLESPQKEEHHGNVNIIGVRSVYDEGKRYGETMLHVFNREYGVETRTVRIFNTYGEYMRSDDGRAIPNLFMTKSQQNCLICKRIKAIKQGKNPYFVEELKTGYVVLGDYQFFQGYTIFLCKEHKKELHELNYDFKKQYLWEMSLVAEAVFKAFKPKKLNYELLGNTDSHLHWHIFPRSANDPLPSRTVWNIDKKVRQAESTKPDRILLEHLKTKLKTSLERVIKKSLLKKGGK